MHLSKRKAGLLAISLSVNYPTVVLVMDLAGNT